MSGIIDCEMHIGDEVFVHGYIDEIRNDTIIIRNVGGYFGTSRDEVFYYEEDERGYGTMNEADRKTENSSEKPNNYCDDCLYTDTCDSKEFFYACRYGGCADSHGGTGAERDACDGGTGRRANRADRNGFHL